MIQERKTTDGSFATSTHVPSIKEVLSEAQKAVSKVRVVHGANEEYFDNLAGKTVGKVRKALREVFNIPGDAKAIVQNQPVEDDFVLQAGESIEFCKTAGQKGNLVKIQKLMGKP